MRVKAFSPTRREDHIHESQLLRFSDPSHTFHKGRVRFENTQIHSVSHDNTNNLGKSFSQSFHTSEPRIDTFLLNNSTYPKNHDCVFRNTVHLSERGSQGRIQGIEHSRIDASSPNLQCIHTVDLKATLFKFLLCKGRRNVSVCEQFVIECRAL